MKPIVTLLATLLFGASLCAVIISMQTISHHQQAAYVRVDARVVRVFACRSLCDVEFEYLVNGTLVHARESVYHRKVQGNHTPGFYARWQPNRFFVDVPTYRGVWIVPAVFGSLVLFLTVVVLWCAISAILDPEEPPPRDAV